MPRDKEKRRRRRKARFIKIQKKMMEKTLTHKNSLKMNTVRQIGRILRENGYKSLSEYYKSESWKQTKQRMHKNSKRPYKCEACWSTNLLSLHHRSYRTLCNEHLRHLCWLCSDCHEMVHKLCTEDGYHLWGATRAVIRRRLFRKKRNGHQ